MTSLFGIFGTQANAALPSVLARISELKANNKTSENGAFVANQLFSNDFFTLMDIGSTQNAQKTPESRAFALQSRLEENAFFQHNCALFECDSAQVVDFYTKIFEGLQLNRSDILSKLEGDFTLAYLEKSERSLTLATSAFNPQTLFYALLPNHAQTFVFASDLKLILALIEPKPNAAAIAMWLAGRPDPNMSMYSNIHQVPQAASVCLDLNGNAHTEYFWDIYAKASRYSNIDSQPLLTKTLSDLLAQSVKLNLQSVGKSVGQSTVKSAGKSETKDASAQLSNASEATQHSPVFTQLSGGMDSTSVSAMAYTNMPNAATHLHSISHTYASTNSCDESDNINAMQKRYNFAQSHFIELDKYTDYSFAQLYPTHPQSPGMVLSPKYHEEAKLLQAAGAQLLLTGNGGDEMFWGHSLAYYDRLKKGDLKVIAEVVKGAKELELPIVQSLRSVFLRPLLQYDILPLLHAGTMGKLKKAKGAKPNELSMPSWLSEEARQLITNAKKRANPFEGKKAERAKYARYEGLHYTSTFNSMRSYQAVFDQYGLQVQHPFFSKDIAEFSFAIEQNKHISGKYPKLLLRQAMSEYLPEQVCWDTHKTVFDQHFAKLVQQNHVALRKLISHEGLQSLGLLNNAKLLATFDALVESDTPSLNVDLLYAILVQSWYQTHILKLPATE